MTVENLEINVKAKGVTAAANRLNSLADAMDRVEGAAGSVSGSSGKSAAKSIQEVGNAAKKATTPIGNFVASLKRIAFYRIIRGVIKSITQAFTEGLEKAYLFSAAASDVMDRRFAAAMDSMKSSANAMKVQLGSAFISLLTALQPIIETLINLVIKLADAISQLFAAFTGTTYIKANKTAAQFADTMKSGGGAAKEWKNQLLGFDEINRLNEPNQGGGGGGKNPLDGFGGELAPINEWIQNLVQNIKDGNWGAVISMLFGKLSETIRKIDWKSLGEKLWGFIKGLFTSSDNMQSACQAFWEFVGNTLGATIMFLFGFFKELVSDIYKHLKANFIDYDGDNKIGIADILKGIWKTGGDLLDWIWESIVQPFAIGLLEVLTGKEFEAKTRQELHEVGKGIIGGIWDGWKEEFEGTTLASILESQRGLIGEIKKIFEIDGGISKVFKSMGEGVVQGFWNGLQSVWSGLKTWWDGLSLGQIHIPHPHFSWTYEEAGGLVAEAMKFVGIPPMIPHLNIGWYANGGFPQAGQLFFANEGSAPEMVGTMGGRTAVATNTDIVEGIKGGVYEAVSSAMNGNSGDVQVRVYLDSREIKAGQQRLNRAWGV